MATSDHNSSPDITASTCLFPSIRSESALDQQNNSLFPIGNTPQSGSNNDNSSSSWLINKSFVPDAAEKLHKLYSTDAKELTDEVEVADEDDEDDEGQTIESYAEDASARESYQKEVRDVKKRKKKKEKKKSKKQKKEAIQPPHEKLYANHSKKVFIEDARVTPKHALYIDRKGDGTNKAFSSMYSHVVANYFVKNKSALGHSKQLDSMERHKKRKSKITRYCSKESIRVLFDESNVTFCGPNGQSQGQPKEIIYLDFPEYKKAISDKELSRGVDLGIYDTNTALYAQGKGGLPSKPDNGDHDKVPHCGALTTQIETYNRLLRETPNDVSMWLEFVDFQNKVMEAEVRSSSTKDGRQVKINSTILVEKKLSILEKALSANPKSVDLAIYQLKLSEELWDDAKLQAEWKKLVFLHPNSISLWKAYLLYAQSNLNLFSVSLVSNVYVKCLTTLRSIAEGNFESHKAPDNLDTSMIEILSDLAHFYHQSGYSEKAVAIFQAMIELNFFLPDSIQSAPLALQLQFLEQFWDGGSNRIGEEDGLGWKNKTTDNSINPSAYPNVDAQEDAIMSREVPQWRKWLEMESLREREFWIPWQPNRSEGQTEEDCEDPERMVLFDDVSPVLFTVTSERSKLILLLQFLLFLGVDAVPHIATLCHQLGCHLQSRFISSYDLSSINLFVYRYKRTTDRDLIPSIADLDCSIWKFARLENFVNNLIVKSIDCFSEPFKTDVKVLWCYLKLREAQNIGGSSKTKKSLSKSIRKEFKSFLQKAENRSDRNLWLTFTQFESSMESYSEAEKNLNFLLASTTDAVSDSNASVYRVYSEMILKMASSFKLNEQKLLWVLAYCGSQEKFKPYESSVCSPHTILKAKKRYSERLNLLLQGGPNTSLVQSSPLIDWITCYTLFTYLIDSIHSAAEIYQSAIRKLELKLDGKSLLEEVYISYIQLMLHHTNTTNSSLAGIRDVLMEAIRSFPENQHFLRLFIDIEERAFISGRQRRLFSHLIKPGQNVHPISWCLGVYAEMNRLENLSSNEESGSFSTVMPSSGSLWWLTSLFEKASQTQSLEHCVYFWRLYIKFEVEHRSDRHHHQHEVLRNAKSIFYRAVQKCPWAKRIYTDACKYFPEDQQQILDLMTEKEIRIRAPVDEIRLLEAARNSTNDH